MEAFGLDISFGRLDVGKQPMELLLHEAHQASFGRYSRQVSPPPPSMKARPSDRMSVGKWRLKSAVSFRPLVISSMFSPCHVDVLTQRSSDPSVPNEFSEHEIFLSSLPLASAIQSQVEHVNIQVTTAGFRCELGKFFILVPQAFFQELPKLVNLLLIFHGHNTVCLDAVFDRSGA